MAKHSGMRIRHASSVTLISALWLGCAGRATPVSLTPEGTRVHVSQGEGLERCEYVGDFASDRMGGRYAYAPGPWASNQVLNMAAASGATDLVWDPANGGSPIGKGYRCP